jgi:antitoxin CcdA
MGNIDLNVAADADLIALATERGISLEVAFDDGVRRALPAKRWAEENAEAIRVHNERIAERGVFGEGFRRW